MLMAENMLKELNREIDSEYMSDNDDIDLGTVLSFYKTKNEGHKLRLSNGEERILCVDQNKLF